MAGIIQNFTRKPFIRIVGGEMVQTVEEDTKGARLRKYELPNGIRGEKWELVYNGWSGTIKNISIRETDYGTVCEVDIDDAILVLNTNSSYFSSFANKARNINFTQPIEVYPYDFINDSGKKIVGLNILQGGNKLENYYYNSKTKNYIKGYPQVDEKAKERLKKNYWKVFFAEVEAFLLSEVEKVIDDNFNTLIRSIETTMGGVVVDDMEEVQVTSTAEDKDKAKEALDNFAKNNPMTKKENSDKYKDKKEVEKNRAEVVDSFLKEIEDNNNDLPF